MSVHALDGCSSHNETSVRGRERFKITHSFTVILGYAVALRYKPEGRGFDSQWCHWNFSLT